MLDKLVAQKKEKWLNSPACPVKELLAYMRKKGTMRATQIESIETYLYLKIECNNKPLWQLFAEGHFLNGTDLSTLNINQKARDYLEEHTAALALFDYARQKTGDSTLLPELEEMIINQPDEIDYLQIIKNFFYNVDYADYLMSLPMGAGKTFLMAAFMYLDLYYANNEPENKAFAHNFLVLVPSGLKSSIIPSLRTIEEFDPAWVIPEPAASELKMLLKFDVLDEDKSAKKSNKARNPNAQKVNQCLPNPFGQVFVVNAEKVILNRLDVIKEGQTFKVQFPESEDEKDKRENELRNLIGKIPNLSILIDEVHHAAKADIKLRQVVNNWSETGNITTILGFSGTPYLSKADRIPVKDGVIKHSQISNTVYYYPLVSAIQDFLKKPKVKVGIKLDRDEIIRKGIRDFQQLYGDKTYKNGAIAKIAIYCPNIKVLEEEVYPLLTGELRIKPDEILKFHKGNRDFPQPEGSEKEFRSLDMPFSRKKYILLVQVGKEGWNCPSLTGVILSQKGASPKNMILQTSCRCLRQVDVGRDETALIWLNDYNANILNEKLKKEQHTSIQEINALKKENKVETIERNSRMEFLNLPSIDFYQLKINYRTLEVEEETKTGKKLQHLLENLDDFKTSAMVTVSELSNLDEGDIEVIKKTGFDSANFNQWISKLSKQSFGLIKIAEFHEFEKQLKPIFEQITYKEDEVTFWNHLYDHYEINSKIRLSFSIKRDLKTEKEVIPKNANLLLIDKLTAAEKNDKLYPNEEDTAKILEVDDNGLDLEIDLDAIKAKFDETKKSLEDQGLGNMILPFEDYKKQFEYSLAVRSKDKTFHYLPYNFVQSGFELEILKSLLKLDVMKQQELEVYYNGERGLTEFVINCFAKNGRNWKNIGFYTTDFLIIKRNEQDKIHKALLLETKGEGYSNDPTFRQKKAYVETDFLRQNNEKFGYNRFDFLYLEDSAELTTNIETISNRLETFFSN